ncbi:MAG TPA: hypothetical protein DCZ97_03380 [Syntrophus sp. (in: bacteria)]|nr:hypothetical protein [Syntrophus sp. (in: bacteria)]
MPMISGSAAVGGRLKKPIRGLRRKSRWCRKPLQSSMAVKSEIGIIIFIIHTKPLHPRFSPALIPALSNIR